MATSIAQPPPLILASRSQPRVSRLRAFLGSLNRWSWGILSLVAGLAVLAAIPVLNLACLGYLLHASGRVADGRRWRDGFPGLDKAARLGKIAAGTWLVTWPLRAVSQLADAAFLVDPEGPTARRWQLAVTLLALATVGHVVWACIRGGKLRYFLWPAPLRFWRWLGSRHKYRKLRDGACEYVLGLRLGHYWRLGLLAALGSLAWLIIPISLLVIAAQLPEGAAALLSLLGAALLIPVAAYLPALQVRFAQTGKLTAFREIRVVRSWFRRRPFAIWFGTLIILGSALPLYLFKIELAPAEIQWLPSLFFVAFAWPARLLIGRLAGAAQHKEQDAARAWRWLWRAATLAVVFGYVLTVYLTQYLSWDGTASLLEQHAFLVPRP